jgi:multiple sugar transport system ATP-binding protein
MRARENAKRKITDEPRLVEDHASEGRMAPVTFEAVEKVYPDGTRAVAGLDLEIPDGEFMVLVGPSGCGKTTALRMVAGLEEITAGTIRIGDRVVNGLEPRKRDVAMVFQNYALYPNMTVYENIAFGLRMRKVEKAKIRERVDQMARVLGLSDLLGRRPGQLSGGQRQRVAMGRAIVRDPSVFLMDEPLSNLDAKLRVQMRGEIARIQGELNATTIYVTHDQVEAMTMGSRVAVLRKGELLQVASPRDLYERPTNLFVASFIGSPSMNLVEARIDRRNGALVCVVAGQALPIPESILTVRPRLGDYVGRTVALGIRPEHLGDGAAAVNGAAAEPGRLRGNVLATELLGSELLVHAQIDAPAVATAEVREVAADVDAAALRDLEREATTRHATVIGRFNAQSTVARGTTVDLAVDTRALQFFDLETEFAITDV